MRGGYNVLFKYIQMRSKWTFHFYFICILSKRHDFKNSYLTDLEFYTCSFLTNVLKGGFMMSVRKGKGTTFLSWWASTRSKCVRWVMKCHLNILPFNIQAPHWIKHLDFLLFFFPEKIVCDTLRKEWDLAHLTTIPMEYGRSCLWKC